MMATKFAQLLFSLKIAAVTSVLLASVFVGKVYVPVPSPLYTNHRAGRLSIFGETGNETDSLLPRTMREEVRNTWSSKDSVRRKEEGLQRKVDTSVNTPNDIKLACHPRKNIVLLKTHKTGSSTVQNILYRFGDTHDLNFALPDDSRNCFGGNERFSRRYVMPLPRGHDYNILANHARWNRTEFHAMMPPDTVYVTVLRHPATQYESLYNYYKWKKHFKLSFKDFVKDPTANYRHLNKSTSSTPFHSFKNPALFDLGVDIPVDDDLDEDFVDGIIQTLNTDFQLVLITEYMEESVILLKNLMCWRWEDIIFFLKNSRPHTSEISPEAERSLIDFNKNDWKLYSYFNKTLWKKISEYGLEKMREDKLTLTENINEWRKRCINGSSLSLFKGVPIKDFDLTMEGKNNEVCKKLVKGAMDYLYFLYLKMKRLHNKAIVL